MNLKFLKLIFLLAVVILSSCASDDLDKEEFLNSPDENKEPPVAVAKYYWAGTADSLQASLNTNFLGGNGTYIQDNLGNGRFHYWPNAHVLNVLIDAYNRTDEEVYLTRAKSLLYGIKTRNGGSYNNVFIDDMLWLGNAAMRAYEASNDEEYKNVAKYLWGVIKRSWSDDVFGGGITWKQDTPFLKNACSNGPAAILAMRLYEVEGDEEYLEWAKKIYEWEKNTLVDPETGLVWDHITIQDGREVIKKDWIFTYNVGTYIGAGVKLYQSTGEQQYLDDAIKTAKAVRPSPHLSKDGILKNEGQGDGGLFKGILVRYFTQLILEPDVSNTDRQHFVQFMKYNSRSFYDNAIKRPSMLVSPNWAAPPGERTDLTTQLSGIMLMEAMALLAEEGF